MPHVHFLMTIREGKKIATLTDVKRILMLYPSGTIFSIKSDEDIKLLIMKTFKQLIEINHSKIATNPSMDFSGISQSLKAYSAPSQDEINTD